MRYRRRVIASGVTLVELVIVIVIVSILGTVVVVSMSSKSEYAVNTQADQFRRDISHLQMLAMAWGVPLRLTTAYDSAVGAYYYQVNCLIVQAGTPCTSTASNSPPTDPVTGATFKVYMTDGVSISPLNSVDFDSMGRPSNQFSGSGSPLITTNPVRDYQLTVNGKTVDVYIRPITGFAETS